MDTASLQLDYATAVELASRPAEWWASVLGVVGFDAVPALGAAQVPITATGTPALGASEAMVEIWRVAHGARLRFGAARIDHHQVQHRCCEDFLFGTVVVDESHYDASGSRALMRATTGAYRRVFDLLETTGHPHLIRVWNYLPDINREVDGDERYRLFNSARQNAFREAGRSTVGSVPAACALGSPAGNPISIYFLAARQPPTLIENPRQTSAYFYPPQFGSHSPTFSRACLQKDAGGVHLFVSGTASIVGYDTVHPGDVAAQTGETVTNIAALLSEANRVLGGSHFSLGDLRFKVYLRRSSDLAAVERALSAVLPTAAGILYLNADICRQELLVEIEAVGGAC